MPKQEESVEPALSHHESLADLWAACDADWDASVARVAGAIEGHAEWRTAFSPLLGGSGASHQPDAAPGAADPRAADSRAVWRAALCAACNGEREPLEHLLRKVVGRMGGEEQVAVSHIVDASRVLHEEATSRLFAQYVGEPRRLRGALGALQGLVTDCLAMLARHARGSMEEQLRAARRAEAKFERLSEAGILGILVCDFEGNIREANQGFLDRFGYTREELLSGEVRWEAMTPPEWKKLDERAVEQIVACGKAEPWEKEYYHKYGHRVPVLVGVASLSEQETIAFVLDITERKRLEELRVKSMELEAQNRRIQEASRLKSEFLANMSHELRTPLNSIIGFAELLHAGEVSHDSPQHDEFLGDILNSGRHLLQLINDVLDLSKVEAGKLEFRPEPVDLEAIVSEVCGVLRAVAAAKQLSLSVHISPELTDVVIDSGRLKQVLYNYLSNACKFTRSGGSIRVEIQPEGTDMFRVIVRDTGIGIAAEDVGRLFTEFQQLEAAVSKKHGGTGLGLALTKRLVEAQNGFVSVKSVLGEGSEFHALLPRHATPAPAAPEPTELRGEPGAAAVLVVEDDPQDRRLLVQTLGRAGYGVTIASSGAEAVATAERHVFDAITLDLLLPDMTGLQVLHRIRVSGKNRNTPVIIVSVVAEKGVVGGFTVQDYLTKPIDGRELLRCLERAQVEPESDASILLVDDDPGSLRLMSATLKPLGLQAELCSSGPAAMAYLEHSKPSAVVVDLLMPGMDGFEFLQHFRARPENNDVPVIVWTMKDLTLSDNERLKVLAQAVVSKGEGRPVSLLEELRGHLGSGKLMRSTIA